MNELLQRAVEAALYEHNMPSDTAERIVRQVIKAMRDPTSSMMSAGSGWELVYDTWTTMIDEALK